MISFDFLKSKLSKYIKYFIIIMFLQNIIHFSDLVYNISPITIKYHRYILMSMLLFTIGLSYYNKTSMALVLSIIIIIYLDRYQNYKEGFKSIKDSISISEVIKYYKKCYETKWKGDECSMLKNEIIDRCSKNQEAVECPPWKKTTINLPNGGKVPLDCPKMYLDIYPGGCD